MKILKWVVIGITALVVLSLVTGLFLPDVAKLERSALIKTKPAMLFVALNGYRQFNKWSPWAQLDPNTRYEFSGPMTGVGAKHAWRSDDPNVGAGSQEIIEVVNGERIKSRLVFEGFDSENFSELRLRAEGEHTLLVWAYEMNCKGQLLCRYFALLLDRALGPQYELGLSRLQTLAESLPQEDFSSLDIQVVETTPMTLVSLPGEAQAEAAGPLLGELYGRLLKAMSSAGATQTDAPLAITREYNEDTRFWKFDAAIPVSPSELALPPDSGITVSQSYAGAAIKVIHTGAYAAMVPTYQKLMAYKTVAGFEDNGNSWEHYITDPGNTPEAQLRTAIYWPVK